MQKQRIERSNMEELTKLWQYLTSHHYICKWIYTEFDGYVMRNQIIVYDNTERSWDAICHHGSQGYEQGLIEIYGEIVHPMLDGDSVVGFLTASEIIEKYIPRLK